MSCIPNRLWDVDVEEVVRIKRVDVESGEACYGLVPQEDEAVKGCEDTVSLRRHVGG
jgi:hypothetical protein